MFRAKAHSKCQNGENCTGPGCRFKSGKTERSRLYKSVRDTEPTK